MDAYDMAASRHAQKVVIKYGKSYLLTKKLLLASKEDCHSTNTLVGFRVAPLHTCYRLAPILHVTQHSVYHEKCCAGKLVLGSGISGENWQFNCVFIRY